MEVAEETPKPMLVQPKKRGRPKTNLPPNPPEVQPAETQPAPNRTFPADSDHSKVPKAPKRLLEAKEFFSYWHSIPEPERSEWFMAYVYRKYPICDIYQPYTKEQRRLMDKKELKKPETNCGKLNEPLDPEDWELQVYERWGAGDYQIRLNDQHPSVHKTVTECHIRGLRDFDNFSPVLKLEEVVLSEEINQPYLRWARLNGMKFPGDPGTESGPDEGQEEQDEMANAAPIVQDALKHAERMTDKVLEMANERQNRSGPTVEPDAASRAQLGAVEAVVEGSRVATKIMGDAMKQALDGAARNNDPREHLKDVIEMAKILQPPAAPPQQNNDMAMMKLMMETQEKNFERVLSSQRESHKETIEMLKSRLESLEREKSAPAAATSSDEAVIEKYARIRKSLKAIEGEDEPAPVPTSIWERLGERAIENLDKLPAVMDVLAKMSAAAVPVVAAPAPAPAPQPQVQPPQESEAIVKKRMYRKQFQPYLLDSLKKGQPGWDLAAGLITAAGPEAYESLVAEGYNGLLEFLKLDEGMFAELITPPLSSVALDKFVNEFLMREKVAEAVAKLTGQTAAPQPQRRGPAVVS